MMRPNRTATWRPNGFAIVVLAVVLLTPFVAVDQLIDQVPPQWIADMSVGDSFDDPQSQVQDPFIPNTAWPEIRAGSKSFPDQRRAMFSPGNKPVDPNSARGPPLL